MTWFDINDGTFSEALLRAQSAKTGDADEAYGAYVSLLEARAVMDALKPTAEMVSEKELQETQANLRTIFLENAESIFQRLWDEAERAGVRAEGIKTRFRALKVLNLAMEKAESSSDKARFKGIYDEECKRIVAFRGTLGIVENEVKYCREDGCPDMALEIAQAGVLWHGTAKILGGTDHLEKLARQCATECAKFMLERAESEADPLEAEKTAVIGLKARITAGGISQDYGRRAWKLISSAVKARLEQFNEGTGYLQTLSNFRDSFWFVPKALSDLYGSRRRSLVEAACRALVERSKKEATLSGKLKSLRKGIEELGLELPPGNEAFQREAKVSELVSNIERRLSSIRKAFASKDFDAALALAEEGVKLINRALGDEAANAAEALELKELYNRAASEISTARMRAEQEAAKKAAQADAEKKAAREAAAARDMAAREMAEAQKVLGRIIHEAPSTAKWTALMDAARTYPGFPEAQELIRKTEEALALRGAVIRVAYSGGRYIWHPKESLMLAREGEEWSMDLASISRRATPVEFVIRGGKAQVIDHNTTNGVYYITGRGDADISLRGTGYRQILPGSPYALGQEGELLVGKICRITYRLTTNSLVLSVLEPFDPREVEWSVELEELWPNWREQRAVTVVLGKGPVILGGDQRGEVFFPKAADSVTSITARSDSGYVVRRVKGRLRASEHPLEEGLILPSVPYKVGDEIIRFS